jgi:glycosyltransferase involved in cell wall biosynthesis
LKLKEIISLSLKFKMKKKIKVLHIITRLILGGAQENTLLTVEKLKESSSFEATLATGPVLSPEGSLFERAEEKKVKVILIPELRRRINPLLDLVAFGKLLILIKKGRYQIIHTHSSKAGVLGRLAAWILRRKIIIHTIHGLPFHPYQNKLARWLYIKIEKLCTTLSDKVITVTDAIAQTAQRHLIGRKEKFITIRSGMELENFLSFRAEPVKIRQKYGIPEGRIVVGKIARLFPLKGHKYILEAAPRVIAKLPQVLFLFVGDGELREALYQEIRARNLENYFLFTGLLPREKIPEIISIMDIVVHTSLREGLARVLVQALALAKPVISFQLDGASEIIERQKTGLLISPGNAQELSEAIIWMAKHYPEAQEMAKEGRVKVKKEFALERMITQISNLYHELINLKRGEG